MADRGPEYRKCFKDFKESNKRSKQSHCRDPHQSPDNGYHRDRRLNGENSNRSSATPCYYYKLGKCNYNDRCRYSHVNPNGRQQTNATSNSLKQSDTASAYLERPSTSSRQDGFNHNRNSRNEPYDNMQIGNNHNNDSSDDEVEGACASPRLVHRNKKSWVEAPEFVPRQKQPKTYAKAVLDREIPKLCPYFIRNGVCTDPLTCDFAHGELCDMCHRFILNPYDEIDRKRHRQECIRRHEKDMELSFAVQRSKGKTCGVCFEIIVEKEDGEQRFGILPNCNHCFCLTCIRTWRKKKRGFENKIIRACPECRVTSDFVCPSAYWVDSKEDKDKLIDDYKKALANKDCKYFKKGSGKCPFGNKCFYMHRNPNGESVDVGPPPRPRQRRQRDNYDENEVLEVMLWDFLDEREFPWHSLADNIEDLVSLFTDSDESGWSDYELFLD